MNHTLNKVRANGVNGILNMIADDTGYTGYKLFATTDGGIARLRNGSLEGLHNSYHNNIG